MPPPTPPIEGKEDLSSIVIFFFLWLGHFSRELKGEGEIWVFRVAILFAEPLLASGVPYLVHLPFITEQEGGHSLRGLDAEKIEKLT